MKYNMWDNDSAKLICSTDNKKEAFIAILNHLIREDGQEPADVIIWPVSSDKYPAYQVPDTSSAISPTCWKIIRQAQEAYYEIRDLIPTN